MAMIEELRAGQIRECLDEAVARAIPVAASCRIGPAWHNLHARFLRVGEGKCWLEYPTCGEGPVPSLAPGQPLGLSFKLRHHKHIFSTTVEAVGEFQLAGAPKVQALCVTGPARMERIQRRAYERVDVPRDRSILAAFWEGLSAEDLRPSLAGLGAPPGRSAPFPAWEGWVTNLSAGGFQVRLIRGGAPTLEVADVVAVRIDLGQEFKPVLAEAQFRHQVTDERGVIMQGFQFVGLNDSAAGHEMLARIGRVVCEFQRLNGRRRANNVA